MGINCWKKWLTTIRKQQQQLWDVIKWPKYYPLLVGPKIRWLIFLFKILFLFICKAVNKRQWEMERNKSQASIYWFTPQSQAPGIWLRSTTSDLRTWANIGGFPGYIWSGKWIGNREGTPYVMPSMRSQNLTNLLYYNLCPCNSALNSFFFFFLIHFSKEK